MPEKRRHRGPDPEDEKLFGSSTWRALRMGTHDLCWLLKRGYAARSAVELVGNRYSLARRQRLAIGRSACSDEAYERRRQHRVAPELLKNEELWLDGYNVLIAVEAALGGAVILQGCDDCHRDIANVYARYREVAETAPALRLIGNWTEKWGVRVCRWWLDRPVSNSGRFKRALIEAAAAGGWDWQVELVFNPDKVLAESGQIVATSDSAILDRCQRWVNLARLIIENGVPHARVVDLSREACSVAATEHCRKTPCTSP